MVNESFLTEASKYKPKFKPADWAKALKELSNDASANYSQLRGMEGVIDEWSYETADEWVEELYGEGKFDPDHKFKDIISDIANFFADYYDESSADYGDDRLRIYRWKRDMSDCDFGVEAENWYRFYEYDGPSSMKKYAQEIAGFGDCSYMDDMGDMSEFDEWED